MSTTTTLVSGTELTTKKAGNPRMAQHGMTFDGVSIDRPPSVSSMKEAYDEYVADADLLAKSFLAGLDAECRDRHKRGGIEAFAAEMIVAACAPVGPLRLKPGASYFADIRPPKGLGVVAAIDEAVANVAEMVAVFAASEIGAPYAKEFEAFIAPAAFAGTGPAPKSVAARQAIEVLEGLRSDVLEGILAEEFFEALEAMDISPYRLFKGAKAESALAADVSEQDLATFAEFLKADKAATNKARRRRNTTKAASPAPAPVEAKTGKPRRRRRRAA